ncbi:MAG: class I SAM-dependent methyltransferase [Candidatus Limnocylindrales bacterium]
MNDLERFFAKNTGRKIHKWKHYFEIYDSHFARFRGTDVHVVEIGVAHGGSLRMWRDYFGPKSRVFGVDIEPNTKAFEEEGVRIIVGDQSDPAFLRSLIKEIPRIDILIDDGGHTMYQQEMTFRTLFPSVSPDGVYLCEDLHTSYWGDFGGGYKRDGTFIELAKSLVDQINAWHSHTPGLVVTDFTRSAHSLHFYDSVLVIEKRPIEPPEVVMTGSDTLVWSDLPGPWPLNSAQLRPSRAKRMARRVPGYGTVARAIRRRKPAWPA